MITQRMGEAATHRGEQNSEAAAAKSALPSPAEDDSGSQK